MSRRMISTKTSIGTFEIYRSKPDHPPLDTSSVNSFASTALVAATTVTLFVFAIGAVGTFWGWAEARRQKTEAVLAATKASESEKQEKLARIDAERNLDRAKIAEKETERKIEQLEKMTRFQAERLSTLDVNNMAASIRATALEQLERNRPKDVDDQAWQKMSNDFLRQYDRINQVDTSLQLLSSSILQPAISIAIDDYRDDPAFQAAILESIGDTCFKLGLYDLAEQP